MPRICLTLFHIIWVRIFKLYDRFINFIIYSKVNGDYYFSKGSKRNIKILKLVENEMVVNNESLGLKG